MAEKFTNRKGTIRLYDGTATPFYIEIAFTAGDLSGPIGRPLVEEIPVLDRGNIDANAHYITGSEQVHLDPLDLSFSCLITDLTNWGYLKDLLRVVNGVGTAVNSNTIVSTKGDTQNDGANNNPALGDSSKLTLNLEYLLDGASSDLGFQFNEVYFPIDQVSMSESEDSVTLALTGKIYGTITDITAWTSGTDMTA